jgi:hypothetical protein
LRRGSERGTGERDERGKGTFLFRILIAAKDDKILISLAMEDFLGWLKGKTTHALRPRSDLSGQISQLERRKERERERERESARPYTTSTTTPPRPRKKKKKKKKIMLFNIFGSLSLSNFYLLHQLHHRKKGEAFLKGGESRHVRRDGTCGEGRAVTG